MKETYLGIIDAAAEKAGVSRNDYVLEAIEEKMKRDGIEYLDDDLGE
ncbi:hypothetical protein [Cohnella abietis]|uniref:Uncharacterized protein n=1 Tax=Cohnella abietis TaxID=2507935 RepID=A0A3T1D950_9BACL|nr:hypothetical protein [Cohnella abietis]BBI34603.1 hypothetical protein KCTCHS21_40020 [Cohnella abietis]